MTLLNEAWEDLGMWQLKALVIFVGLFICAFVTAIGCLFIDGLMSPDRSCAKEECKLVNTGAIVNGTYVPTVQNECHCLEYQEPTP